MEKWLCRQEGLISAKGQRALANATVGVAGLGGVGGICAELLVRAGAGSLRVADFDKFDKTNFNRQIHSSHRTLGKNKCDAFASLARKINPKLKIRKFKQRLDEENALSFISGCSIVVDCMDNIRPRVALFRACKKLKVPYVYAAATGERGMVSVFLGKADLEAMLRLPSKNKTGEGLEAALVKYPQCQNSWGAATNLVGVLAANQALNSLLGKPAVRAPSFLAVGAFEKCPVRAEKL